MKVRGSLVLLFTLSACQSDSAVWYKGGASESDYQRDTYECERDTRMAAASFGTGPVGAANAEAFAARCMNARGYYRVPASQARARPWDYLRSGGMTARPCGRCLVRAASAERYVKT